MAWREGLGLRHVDRQLWCAFSQIHREALITSLVEVVYVNNRWCKTVVVSLCAKDLELLSVSMLPFYLPREFLQIFVTVIYVHPKANINI